jgi:hypothetical protein
VVHVRRSYGDTHRRHVLESSGDTARTEVLLAQGTVGLRSNRLDDVRVERRAFTGADRMKAGQIFTVQLALALVFRRDDWRGAPVATTHGRLRTNALVSKLLWIE